MEMINLNDIINIGSGLSLDSPFSDITGSSNVVSNVDRINQSIRIILSTAKGEVPMRPNLGSNIPLLTFDGITDSLLTTLEIYAQEALYEQEPRINVTKIVAETDYEHTINLNVEYVIKNTNISANTIYTVDTNE